MGRTAQIASTCRAGLDTGSQKGERPRVATSEEIGGDSGSRRRAERR